MEHKLERKYGLFTAICLVVGIVIGSGVFFKAQTILQKTEGNMPLGNDNSAHTHHDSHHEASYDYSIHIVLKKKCTCLHE